MDKLIKKAKDLSDQLDTTMRKLNQILDDGGITFVHFSMLDGDGLVLINERTLGEEFGLTKDVEKMTSKAEVIKFLRKAQEEDDDKGEKIKNDNENI